MDLSVLPAASLWRRMVILVSLRMVPNPNPNPNWRRMVILVSLRMVPGQMEMQYVDLNATMVLKSTRMV